MEVRIKEGKMKENSRKLWSILLTVAAIIWSSSISAAQEKAHPK